MPLLCAAVSAVSLQITAFLLSSMPMHPKQNLAAANRYGAPLFLRKSHQRFSLPFLCSAIPYGAVPCHSFATLRFSFALPGWASQCRCAAVVRDTSPLHSSSPHSLRLATLRTAVAHLLKSRQCLCQSVPLGAWLSRCHSAPYAAFAVQFHAHHRHRQANPRASMPLRLVTTPSLAMATPGCTPLYSALALRLSPHRRCK